MNRRLWVFLLLVASLMLAPLSWAASPCCEGGACDRPSLTCTSVCAACPAPAALPATQVAPAPHDLAMAWPAPGGASERGSWIDEVWTPPD